MEQQTCPFCNTINPSMAFFCLQCGKKLKEPPVSTSIGKQVIIYLVSFFLPPLGLGWTFKYIKQKDEKAKIIGWVSLVLTIVSVIITIGITMSVMRYYSDLLNGISAGNIPQSDQQMLQQIKGLQ